MSLINQQINELIKDKLEYQNDSLNVQVKFDENFIGFQGHFPGNPVLPGVVMIKTMTLMYELYKKKEFTLSQIKQAKFIEPVFADTLTSFFVKSNIDKEGIKLQGKVFKSEKVIAKISLILQEQ
ncbi:MAG: hypothetical protein KAR45_08985 [Desulfobacteraceae bacterium]|nr:hypothetical protein [Desulfobacteraceae bacterium]